MSYKFNYSSVTKIVTDVCNKLEYAAKEKDLSFVYTAAENIPEALIDEKQLTMAISNLVDNAIKYTPSGGTVSITTTSDQDKIYIKIVDTGIGIPSSQLSMLFSKFSELKMLS